LGQVFRQDPFRLHRPARCVIPASQVAD